MRSILRFLRKTPSCFAVVAIGVSACTLENPSTGPVDASPTGSVAGFGGAAPADVAAVAAPNQDLSFVQLNPDDNCYWYRHRGPVETTMLPLRTTAGRPICVAAAEPAPTA